MMHTPAFEDLLTMIEDRSTTLRSSVAAARDLDIRVPSCPDWSLRDLVEHVAGVQRFWATAVSAGSSEHPPTVTQADLPLSAGLLDRSAAATQDLISALHMAGPEPPCWTWWGDSDVPMTTGAVARHQIHEAAVHAFDAQRANGSPQPVPARVALDGISEFIGVSHGTAGPWPHQPVRIGLHADEGGSWLVDMTASGARIVDGQHETIASLHGPASDLLLTLHGRLRLDRLRTEGDYATLENLLSWPDLG
jgi:uncharacterized protein (TIGR03083 family)